MGVYGGLMIVHLKQHSIYLRGTIGFRHVCLQRGPPFLGRPSIQGLAGSRNFAPEDGH